MGRGAFATVLLSALFVVPGKSHGADIFNKIATFQRNDYTSFATVSPAVPLQHYVELQTNPNQYWVVEVIRPTGGTRYCMVVGPDPTGPSSARGIMIIRDSTKYGPEHQELAIITGIAYSASVTGQHPYGGTQGGSGASEGTLFMTYGQAGNDYFILFDQGSGAAEKLKIWPVGNSNNADSTTLEPAGYFLEVPDTVTTLNGAPPTEITKTTQASLRRTMFRTLVQVDIAVAGLGSACPELELPKPFWR